MTFFSKKRGTSMKRSVTIWLSDAVRRGGALPLLLSLAVAGCHSTRFGEMDSDPPALIARVQAVFGTPTTVSDESPLLVQVAGEKKSSEPEQSGQAPEVPVQIIDLPTALARAGADNPTIALADEAIRASLAEQMQARTLLLPTLDVGTNLRLHRGNFLSGRGVITDVNIQSLYWGFGADAKGGGTLAVPGLRVVSHLADAWYAPQAAQQRVVQSRFDASATRSYLLMEVGIRYLALVEAQARHEAYRQSLQDLGEIERLTANFAKAKEGRDADAQRARTEALLLRAESQRAEEAIGVAAAELARLLDADPALPLRGAERVPPVLELVDRNESLPHLLDQALANHPEIVARGADVGYQEIRVRQERIRPYLPLVAVGFSAGQFGGSGPDTTSRLGSFSPRTDLDVVAIWSLQGFGLGNRAVQQVAQSNLETAQIDYARLLDRVRREVVEAHTLVSTRRQEMELIRKRVESSQSAYTQDLIRARNNQGRPIEVLISANQLSAARQDLVRAMIGYSQAQLQLRGALGTAP